MDPGNALVVGAGTAGCAAAWHLHRTGWAVTLVDPDHALPGGPPLQLDLATQGLLRMMGASGLVEGMPPGPSLALCWDDGRPGRRHARNPGVRATSHPRLVGALRSLLPAEVVRVRAGLADLDVGCGRVRAAFSDGTEGEFTVVVGADGLRSCVRSHLLGTGHGVVRKGFSWVWSEVEVPLPGGRGAIATTDRSALQLLPSPRTGGTSVLAGLALPPGAPDRPAAVRAGVSGLLAELGEDLVPLARALRDSTRDPVFTSADQVRISRWSRGPVVLVGDAAHCIDPVSVLGVSAAIRDGAILARSLSDAEDLGDGFATFEALARPAIDATQDLVTATLHRVVHPPRSTRRSWARRGTSHGLVAWSNDPVLGGLLALAGSGRSRLDPLRDRTGLAP